MWTCLLLGDRGRVQPFAHTNRLLPSAQASANTLPTSVCGDAWTLLGLSFTFRRNTAQTTCEYLSRPGTRRSVTKCSALRSCICGTFPALTAPFRCVACGHPFVLCCAMWRL